MGLKRLDNFLRRHRRIALDSSIFIYQLESNPKYVQLTDRIFDWLRRPGSNAVSSTITMTELLAQPYKDDAQLRVNLYYAHLSVYPNLTWHAPDLETADIAARLRASHRLRTPDALLAATAISQAATGMITNDAVFERVDEFETLVLDRLL